MTNEKIEFFVPGIPRPGGSKSAFPIINKTTGKPVMKDGRIMTRVKESGKHTPAWRADVKHFAFQVYDGEPLQGPLALSVVFHLPRPQGHYGTGRNAGKLKSSAPPYPTTMPDATKLLRAVEDALTGGLWRDDSQIVAQVVSKRYAAKPGAEIMVRSANEAGLLVEEL